jgi:geranylgeranyl pyrophosphate synthase
MQSKEIFRSVRPQLERVEALVNAQAGQILAFWSQEGEFKSYLDRASRHLFLKPGKLLRPALVLLSAGVIQDGPAPERQRRLREDNLVSLAAAAELIHSASLIHDDIIDDEQLRRGQPSLNRKYGTHTAVLIGDTLYARAFGLLTGLRLRSQSRHLRIFRLFTDITERMCLGEIGEQEVLEEGRSLRLAEYLEILRNKTAVLMSACCHSAAITCEAEETTLRTLSEFGLSFGMAFQLFDDYSDHDPLASPEFEVFRRANEYMERARQLLSSLNHRGNGSQRELLAACDYVAARAMAPVVTASP